MEVPQGVLDGGFHLRGNTRRLLSLRQRPALASLRDDAMLALDLCDVPGRDFPDLLLQHTRPDLPVRGGVVGHNVGKRFVVQVDVLPAFQKFPTYADNRRRLCGAEQRHLQDR